VERERGEITMGFWDGVPVACVVGVLRASTPIDTIDTLPFLHGRVIEIYVDPAYRGRSIASSLLRHIEDFFCACGCSIVELGCLASNQNALALYRRQGYEERSVEFFKEL
jgi:ribosomal protein S18 acetylase RimI-like enzyme